MDCQFLKIWKTEKKDKNIVIKRAKELGSFLKKTFIWWEVSTMSFAEVNIKEIIDKEKQSNSSFSKLWDESRTEYKLLAEFVRLRKEQKITQEELAKRTGNKQQVISRIEKRENSPTLKTFCGLLNTLGYDLKIVKHGKA